MQKLTYASLLLILTACTVQKTAPAPQQRTKQQQTVRPRQVSDKYILTTQFGHKLEIEMDYAVGKNGYINNGCQAQYIVTNVGSKEIDFDKKFTTGAGTKINTTWFDSTYKPRYIIFEFATNDGKRIETKEYLASNGTMPVGKSFAAETVKIDAGSRACISVKPLRIEMEKGLQVGNSPRKK